MTRKAKAANERVKVKNLQQKEQKLSKGEQKKVKGGGNSNNYFTNDYSLTVTDSQSETASPKRDGGSRK